MNDDDPLIFNTIQAWVDAMSPFSKRSSCFVPKGTWCESVKLRNGIKVVGIGVTILRGDAVFNPVGGWHTSPRWTPTTPIYMAPLPNFFGAFEQVFVDDELLLKQNSQMQMLQQ